MTKKTEISNVNGVIDTRKLIRILGFNPPSPRLKTASTPVEPIVTQSPAGKDLEKLANTLREHATLMKKYSPVLFYIFELQFYSGCRISEILAINPVDILLNGNVRIRGKKKSSNRIISAGQAVEYLLSCKKNNIVPFKDYNRKFVWSIYKKFGIEIEVGTSGKKAVTHSLRHLNVSLAKQAQIPINETAQYMGHKNSQNTKNYGQIKKQ